MDRLKELSVLRTIDPDSLVWTDAELLQKADKHLNKHLVFAECLKELATTPAKARIWERGGVKYCHYDYLEMAEYHNEQALAGKGKL